MGLVRYVSPFHLRQSQVFEGLVLVVVLFVFLWLVWVLVLFCVGCVLFGFPHD